MSKLILILLKFLLRDSPSFKDVAYNPMKVAWIMLQSLIYASILYLATKSFSLAKEVIELKERIILLEENCIEIESSTSADRVFFEDLLFKGE